MTTPAETPVYHPKPTGPHPLPDVTVHPIAARQTVTTTRATGARKPAHPAVWEPWTVLAERGEAEFKAAIATALKIYQGRFSAASKVLDTAQAMAAEQSGTLQAAAWAEWTRRMEAADHLWSAIMTPALSGYDREIDAAQAELDKTLADAEKTFRNVMAGVHRAKNDGTAAAAGS